MNILFSLGEMGEVNSGHRERPGGEVSVLRMALLQLEDSDVPGTGVCW